MEENVLIIQRRMPKYRVPMFEALHKSLEEKGIRLNVIYGMPTRAEVLRGDEGTLSWGIKSSCHYLHVANLQLVWQGIPPKFLSKQDLIIIPHENSLLANYILLQRRRLGNVKLAFWGHGANFQSLDPDGYRETFKAWTARKVDWWFAYSSLSVEKVTASGFPPARITCLNNAVDVAGLLKWRAGFTEEERAEVLQELGMRGERVGVFLGSLYQEKRLDFLFAAADSLRERFRDFELLVVGDGPQQDKVKAFAAARPWCHWVGACQDREKARYVRCGQVMLNPGLVGLTILDSFALGVPIVATDCGIHSPEIVYMENGRNGIMTANNLSEYVEYVEKLLSNKNIREEMSLACIEDAQKFSLENMVKNFCGGILQALGRVSVPQGKYETPSSKTSLSSGHIAIIWQRFLPYHKARIRHLQRRLEAAGYRLTAIEVASQDASYGFKVEELSANIKWLCCYPRVSYHDLNLKDIHAKVLATLKEVEPDLVFAPATPFPEGMAGVRYRCESACRVVMMDDAWEHTDRRGQFTRRMKRLIHQNIDGVFIPAPSHRPYYLSLGFPAGRVVYGVDVVDNEFFSRNADLARRNAMNSRLNFSLPDNKYFLFVGRFLPRKGLETLLSAFDCYRSKVGQKPWDLVLVGGGSHADVVRKKAKGIEGIQFAGAQFGEALCCFYGLAGALVVPSESDPWALVVNEGMAAGLPLVVSSGCGAARTLVHEGGNGWTFSPSNVDELAEIMLKMAALPDDSLAEMGRRSREIIADWSLERFADGALQALKIPRKEQAGPLPNLLTKLWKGKVRVN